MNVFDLFAASQLVQNIVYEIEQLEDQIPNRHLFLFAEVDQLPIEAPPHRPPLVLLNKGAAVEPEPKVLTIELVQFSDYGLDQRRKGDHLIDLRREVAYPEFQSREGRMRSYVPPYLLRLVDAAGLQQKSDIVVILGPGAEIVGYIGARELLEDLTAIAFQPGVRSD